MNNESDVGVQGVSEGAKEMLKKASQYFHNNQYEKAQNIYSKILESPTSSLQQKEEALKNRASLYLATKEFKKCLQSTERYLNQNKKVGPQIYVMYVTVLLKMENIGMAKMRCKQGLQIYPFHKKLQDLAKLCHQKQKVETQDTYVQNVFEKLCLHPKIREYLKEESFLTKVERVIRNPSLASVMAKMDPRIMEVTEFMLMAEEQD